jgi:hypothetical protein
VEDAETEYVDGVFWQIDTPDRRVRGQLKLAATDLPELIVDGLLFDERSYSHSVTPTGMTIAKSADPHDRVADFQPWTIHGELSDGSPVSALDARGGSRSIDFNFSQQFRCRRVVVGAHVDGQQAYAATRFRLVKGYWPLPAGEATTGDGSILRVRPVNRPGDAQWFEFEPAQPATLNYLDLLVVHPIITLYSLVMDNPTDQRDPEVRLDPDSPWRPIYEGTRDPGRQGHNLLPTKHLTPERFARWIDLRPVSDGLDAAALDELKGVTIQTQVLALSAIAEGLHRKLFSDPARARRVPAVSKQVCRQAREAAHDAAVAELAGDHFTDDDRAEFGQAVTDALAHVNDRTFRSRMRDLVDVAEHSAPGITDSFNDWPAAVVKARNILAHRGTPSLGGEFEAFIDLLIAIKHSMRWVLRTVLLNRAGIDPSTIQDGYRDSSAYGFHLANVRGHLLANGHYVADGLQPG